MRHWNVEAETVLVIAADVNLLVQSSSVCTQVYLVKKFPNIFTSSGFINAFITACQVVHSVS